MVPEGLGCLKESFWAKKSFQGKGAERDFTAELGNGSEDR
jgi:hypothetical protein